MTGDCPVPSGPPPTYSEEPNKPLLVPGEAPPARGEGDHVPDDFKYSTSVVECSLPICRAYSRRTAAIWNGHLLMTTVIYLTIVLNGKIHAWALTNIWAFYVSLFGSIVLMIGAFIKQRSYPTNLLFLAGFTVLESYAVGVVLSRYDIKIILRAMLIAFVVVVGLTLLAMQTKYDPTGWQMYLSGALWALIGFGFIAMFFPYSSGVELGYSIIGALVFSGYMLVETLLICTICSLTVIQQSVQTHPR
jgi:FtsH-binding integral membrane protein